MVVMLVVMSMSMVVVVMVRAVVLMAVMVALMVVMVRAVVWSDVVFMLVVVVVYLVMIADDRGSQGTLLVAVSLPPVSTSRPGPAVPLNVPTIRYSDGGGDGCIDGGDGDGEGCGVAASGGGVFGDDCRYLTFLGQCWWRFPPVHPSL